MASDRKYSSVEEILQALGIHEVPDLKEALARELTKPQQKTLLQQYEALLRDRKEDFADRALLDYPFADRQRYSLLARDETLEKRYLGSEQLPWLSAMGGWLVENQNLLGKRILDAGCGCGILSLLAAALLPGAEVTGVSYIPEETALASTFAKELGLGNITFVTGDILQAPLEAEPFDTVLALQVLNENTHLDEDAVRYGSFAGQIRASRDNVAAYVTALCRLVGEHGTLITCDAFPEIGTYYLGYLTSLAENGLAPDLSRYTLLPVPGMLLPVTVSFRGEVPGEKQLFKAFRKIAFAKTADPEQYTRPQADWFLSRCAGEILQGFLTDLVLPGGKEAAMERHLLCRYEGNPDLVLYEATDPERFSLRVLPESQTDAIENMLDSLEREARAQGYRTKALPADTQL